MSKAKEWRMLPKNLRAAVRGEMRRAMWSALSWSRSRVLSAAQRKGDAEAARGYRAALALLSEPTHPKRPSRGAREPKG